MKISKARHVMFAYTKFYNKENTERKIANVSNEISLILSSER